MTTGFLTLYGFPEDMVHQLSGSLNKVEEAVNQAELTELFVSQFVDQYIEKNQEMKQFVEKWVSIGRKAQKEIGNIIPVILKDATEKKLIKKGDNQILIPSCFVLVYYPNISPEMIKNYMFHSSLERLSDDVLM